MCPVEPLSNPYVVFLYSFNIIRPTSLEERKEVIESNNVTPFFKESEKANPTALIKIRNGHRNSAWQKVISAGECNTNAERQRQRERERVKNHYMVSLDVLSFFNSHIMYTK